jgi:hypothetical protein
MEIFFALLSAKKHKMIVLGDDEFGYEDIIYISDAKEILSSPVASTVLIDFSSCDNLQALQNENIGFGLIVDTIKQAIMANRYGAKYIISNKKLSIKLQKIADNYLFDSKIIAIIEKNQELEKSAILGIDGVIFNKIIKN